jgi:hypothetical protein
MAENLYPSEVISLPSKGWYYPDGHPLATGTIDLYYMTAKHEDILTSKTLIQRGVVIDKLLDALIVSKDVKYDDLLVGDKNGLMVAARIMGYGKDYDATVTCPSCNETSTHTINLESIDNKKLIFDPKQKGKNEFEFQLPFSKKVITFRLLTHKDEKDVQADLDAMRKVVKSEVSSEVTTRMKKSIVAVDGIRDTKVTREFVDAMPARDAMAFREHVRAINPDIDLKSDFVCPSCAQEFRLEVPIDVNFFWPNANV